MRQFTGASSGRHYAKVVPKGDVPATFLVVAKAELASQTMHRELRRPSPEGRAMLGPLALTSLDWA